MILNAICIGINIYEDPGFDSLDNAGNDASAIASKFEQLGSSVELCLNTPSRQSFAGIENCINSTLDEVNSVSVIYFSGHGFELDGENYLAFVDVNLASKAQAEISCIRVTDILKLAKAKQKSSTVLILDCCRKVPAFRDQGVVRGGGMLQLAPIVAPSGTLIAFSTSPGEPAKDAISGGSDNSPYAIAFLKALSLPNISIESLFKNTRGELHRLTRGAQNSWEHTSLVGNIIINQGISTDLSSLEYSVAVLKDKSKYSSVDYIIEEFFNKLNGKGAGMTWSTQKSALTDFGNGQILLSPDEAFLFGRNYVAILEGGSYAAGDIFRDNPEFLSHHLVSQENHHHFCRGMLFEVYFNSSSEFRLGRFKSIHIALIHKFIRHLGGEESFEWIASSLGSHRSRLPILPAVSYIHTPVVSLAVSEDKWNNKIAVVSALYFDGSSNIMRLLYNGELIDIANLDPATEFYMKFSTSAEVKAHLCTLLAVTDDAFELDIPALVPPQTKYAFSDRTVILLS